MPMLRYKREANEAFAWHFARYAEAAGRQSVADAAETETNPRVLLRFAEARFHTLIHGFEDSFFELLARHRPPFPGSSEEQH